MFDTGVKAVPKNVVREVSVSKEGKCTTAEFVDVELVDFLEVNMSETGSAIEVPTASMFSSLTSKVSRCRLCSLKRKFYRLHIWPSDISF